MKAKKLFVTAAALAVTLFLAACSNMNSGSVDGGAVESRNLSFYIENADELGLVADPNSYTRTVMPESLNVDTGLTLVLKALNHNQGVKWFVFDAGSKASGAGTPADPYKFNLSLDADTYNFWLYAYNVTSVTSTQYDDDGDGAVDTALPTAKPTVGENIFALSELGGGTKLTTALWAHTEADLTAGGQTIAFTLTSAGLDGSGTVTLAGDFTDTEGVVKTYTVGLYDWYTNEPVLVSGVIPVNNCEAGVTIASPTASASPVALFSVAADAGYTAAVDHANSKYTVPVKAGVYRAYISLKNTEGKEVGNWTDQVIVEPANDAKKDNISITNLNKRPAAPAGLTAYLVTNSWTNNDGTYKVALVWKDMADNEKGYLVRVAHYKYDTAAGATQFMYIEDDAYDASPSDGVTYTSGIGILGSNAGVPTLVAGSVSALTKSDYFATEENSMLYSGATSVVLTLRTGEIYDFAVQAWNDIGFSDNDDGEAGFQWTPRDTAATATVATNVAPALARTITPVPIQYTKVTNGTPAGAPTALKIGTNAAPTGEIFGAAAETADTYAAGTGTNVDGDAAIYYTTNDGTDIRKYGTIPDGTSVYVKTPGVHKHVALTQIKYDLNGGSYFSALSPSPISTTTPQYVYWKYGTDTMALWAPTKITKEDDTEGTGNHDGTFVNGEAVDTTEVAPVILKGSITAATQFEQWVDKAANGVLVGQLNYNNQVLYASYGTTAISVYNPDLVELDPARVYATYGANNAITYTTASAIEHAGGAATAIAARDNPYIYLGIDTTNATASSASDEKIYTKTLIKIDGAEAKGIDPTVTPPANIVGIVVDISEYDAKYHNVEISGYDNVTKKWYTCSFQFRITR